MEAPNNENLNNNLNTQNQNNPTQEQPTKKAKRYHGKIFIIIIFIALILEYYIYVFLTVLPNITQSNLIPMWIIIFLFNVFIGLMLWAFFTTMNTHPGEIPLYWGFYIGDDDYKRKRYCLICNAFKPERSHHCSICNVCILNMDHHCPWVDNCIGFYNRKFFMQLLFFLTLLLIYVDATGTYFIYLIGYDIYKEKMNYQHKVSCVFAICAYLFFLVFTVVIIFFFKFHINLVLNNSSTIESLEKEDEQKRNENLKFKLSYLENWQQVFGENRLMWFFPIMAESGRPCGDGLSWKINEKNVGTNVTNGNANNNNDQNNSRQGAEMQNYTSDHPMINQGQNQNNS